MIERGPAAFTRAGMVEGLRSILGLVPGVIVFAAAFILSMMLRRNEMLALAVGLATVSLLRGAGL